MLNKLRGLGRLTGAKVDHPLADPREMRRIIDQISGDDTLRAIDEVVGWLESLGSAPEFPEDHLYEVVSRLDDAAQPHLKRLERNYLHTQNLSRTEGKRIWTTSHGFWTLLATSYERCLAAAGEKSRVGSHLRQNLPALTARLIAALAAILKWEQFNFGKSTGELWRRLGAALLSAENAGVATRAIQLHANASRVTSPQQEFIKGVAFQAASLDGLLPLEVDLAERLIAHFLPGFVFSAVAEIDSIYWVDLALAEPPRRLTRGPAGQRPTQRFFKPGTAPAGIDALLNELERGHDVSADITLGGHYHARVLLPVVRHLATYLAPIPPQRRHDRHPVKQHAIVLHGLANAFGAFSGQFTTRVNGDPTAIWAIEDVSRGGFGALLDSIPGDGLRVGALIAMQQAGREDWWLGIVRRYRRTGESELRVGVETLTRQAMPAELKPRAASSYAAVPGIRVLLLREGGAPGEVRAVMPFGAFDLRTTLEWNDNGTRVQLAPVAIVEQASDYDLARYRLTPVG
ncbi:MAG: hypothetical protein WBO95_01100 [Candidatus Dechloromonas phosphoritropha]